MPCPLLKRKIKKINSSKSMWVGRKYFVAFLGNFPEKFWNKWFNFLILNKLKTHFDFWDFYLLFSAIKSYLKNSENPAWNSTFVSKHSSLGITCPCPCQISSALLCNSSLPVDHTDWFSPVHIDTRAEVHHWLRSLLVSSFWKIVLFPWWSCG